MTLKEIIKTAEKYLGEKTFTSENQIANALTGIGYVLLAIAMLIEGIEDFQKEEKE